jgi:hypothetical protein
LGLLLTCGGVEKIWLIRRKLKRKNQARSRKTLSKPRNAVGLLTPTALNFKNMCVSDYEFGMLQLNLPR